MGIPTIWAIGGGKGGIGKTMLSGNLGIVLAQNGKKVTLIDSDLGGANLHTCLGISSPQVGLSDFILRHVSSLEETIIPTSIPNLNLISGAKDTLNISNPKYTQKRRLLNAIQKLDADHIILDLGAGSNFNMLDFFLLADPQIILAVPEPTSIENAYRFIKSAFYRKIRQDSPTSYIKKIVDETMDKNNQFGIRTPQELLAYLRDIDDEMKDFVDRQLIEFRPKLVLNQIRSEKDVKIGFAMGNACKKYFGIHLDFIGYVDFSDEVWQSIVQRQPLLANGAQSIVADRIRQVCDNLLNDHHLDPDSVF